MSSTPSHPTPCVSPSSSLTQWWFICLIPGRCDFCKFVRNANRNQAALTTKKSVLGMRVDNSGCRNSHGSTSGGSPEPTVISLAIQTQPEWEGASPTNTSYHLLSRGTSSSGTGRSPVFSGLPPLPTCGGDNSNGNLLRAAGDGFGVLQRSARMPEVVIVRVKEPHGARPKSCRRVRQNFPESTHSRRHWKTTEAAPGMQT